MAKRAMQSHNEPVAAFSFKLVARAVSTLTFRVVRSVLSMRRRIQHTVVSSVALVWYHGVRRSTFATPHQRARLYVP